ncbi:MAG TPA: hypothetical protein VMF52_16480 [Steroidobacteraceae bacterium]|nr:hypothetical protein [Steroidobacteraceae bacterium]
MKILRGIDAAIAGERVLGTQPVLAPYVTKAVSPPPRRRANFFTGRALSHLALTDEQRDRMADAARVARAVAPGVIEGFEVALEGTQLVIMPGRAIAADGEDVELHYPLRLAPDSIPLDSASLTRRLAPEGDAADDALRARLTGGESFTPGKLRALDRLDLLPHALVLVAQPLTLALDRSGELDSPCPNAVNEGAFSQLAWEDGFRLCWVPWPSDATLPPWTLDGTTIEPRFRNRLAYAAFNRERERTEITQKLRRLALSRGVETDPTRAAALDAEMVGLAARAADWPWATLGIALALVGFDAAFAPAFSDRNSLVRQGGGRANRTALNPFAGEDVLWQARVAQLIEHLAELPPEQRKADALAKTFDWLPPAGVLPKDAIDVAANRQFVFPPSFDVQAQPVPVDMVDALLLESSMLAPYSLSVRDQVQILVPVPAKFFEPDLLQLDLRIHPLFDSEVARLERARLSTLVARDRLRRRFDTLSHAVTGRLPWYSQDDPDALPDETGALDSISFARVHRAAFAAGQTTGHSFRNAAFSFELAASDQLFVFVRLDTVPAGITLQPFTGDTAKQTIYWGSGAPPAGAVNAGPLPATPGWVRLSVPVATAGLSATTIDGLAYGVIGGAAAGSVAFGYAGKAADGREMYWVSDALPQGAVPHDNWEWQEQGENTTPDLVDAANGIAATGDVRSASELDTLVTSFIAYRGGVLKGELGIAPSTNPALAGAGLDELIRRVETRIAAANDHIEFGFLRARTDIYRVRQNVLGVGQAGRLLTSPTAAELITRNDNPVATDKDFADYFKRAGEPVTSAAAPSVAPAVAPTTPAAAPAAPSAPTFTNASLRLLRTNSIGSALSLNTSASAPQSAALSASSSALSSGALLSGSVFTPIVTTPAGGISGSIGSLPVFTPVTTPASTFGGSSGSLLGGSALLNSNLLVNSLPTLAINTTPTVKEVTGTSLFGATLNTVTVGERLSGSAAVVAKNAAASGKSDFVKSGVNLLADKGFALGDLPVFGYKPKDGAATDVTAKDLADGKLDDTDAEEPEGTDVAESVYFKRGLDAIDNLVRFLRGVEIRVEDYKRLQTDANAARTRVLAALGRLENLMSGLATALAETRHDLAVARALRAEELQRVAGIVARRKAILAEHVPFVVFRRPRLTKILLDVPVRTVQPAIVDDPVPRCRADTHDVPAELQAMVDTLKDVPAVWIRKLQPLILKFDHLDSLQTLLGNAAQRISLAAAQPPLQLVQQGAATKTGALISNLFQKQTTRMTTTLQKQSLVLNAIKSDTWKNVINTGATAVSASDLISAGAANKKITLEASGELDDIAGVASCLYNAFCDVPPATRLTWAERFSQLDPDISLRVLTVLPGFGDERLGVDYIQWKQMQKMVDWLFSRVADEADAIAAINDLVQVALLLSAHAPVKRIISARVRKPVRPVLNGRLDLAVDPRVAKIGMQVLVHAPTGNLPIARAVVEDLASDGVVARFAEVMQPAFTIDSSMRVQLQSGPPLTTAATAAKDKALVGLKLLK